jgi:hypothetical protein
MGREGFLMEEGGCDAMVWEEEVDPQHLQTLTYIRLYLKKQGSEQKSSDEGLDEGTVLKPSNKVIHLIRLFSLYKRVDEYCQP